MLGIFLWLWSSSMPPTFRLQGKMQSTRWFHSGFEISRMIRHHSRITDCTLRLCWANHEIGISQRCQTPFAYLSFIEILLSPRIFLFASNFNVDLLILLISCARLIFSEKIYLRNLMIRLSKTKQTITANKTKFDAFGGLIDFRVLAKR